MPPFLEPRNGLGGNLPRLLLIMRKLLGPQGCPWDQQQTLSSLRRYVLEEACEVIDAIDENDPDALREELGDLLLQIAFQSELSRNKGDFDIDRVIDGICDKLVRRHPHIFSDTKVKNAEQVHQNWERIKATEKQRMSILDGIPTSLPALARAQRLGEKSARVGFDWPHLEGCREKVNEELSELDDALAAHDRESAAEELGDLLFTLANLARHIGVDAEMALRETNEKFVRRFQQVEQRVRVDHGGFESGPIDIDTLERYWQQAKQKEPQ